MTVLKWLVSIPLSFFIACVLALLVLGTGGGIATRSGVIAAEATPAESLPQDGLDAPDQPPPFLPPLPATTSDTPRDFHAVGAELLTTDVGSPTDPKNFKIALQLPPPLTAWLPIPHARHFRVFILPEGHPALLDQTNAVPSPASSDEAGGLLPWRAGDTVYLDVRTPPAKDVPGRYAVLVEVWLDGMRLARTRPPGHVRYRLAQVDVALVIDSSRSMRRTDREDRRLDAARAFVDQAARDGRIQAIGVVSFDSVARIEVPLISVEEQARLHTAIGRIHPDGMTNIDHAIERAAFILQQGRAPRQAILLLTDGRSEPMPYRDTHHRIQERAIPVYAIGFSEEADHDLLDRIARDTGGVAYRAAGNQELMAIYHRIASALRREDVLLSRDLPATDVDGRFRVPLDETIRHATFFVDQDAADLQIDLARSFEDGRLASPAMVRSGGKGYQTLRLSRPTPGIWSFSMRRADHEDRDATRAACEVTADTPLYLDAFPPYREGNRIWLAATIASGGEALVGGRVRVIPDPASGLPAWELYDDGAHRDGAAGDGVFAGFVELPVSHPGGLEVRIRAWGTTPGGHEYVRQRTVTLPPFETLPVPSASHTPPAATITLTHGDPLDFGHAFPAQTLTAETAVTLMSLDPVPWTPGTPTLVTEDGVFLAPVSVEVTPAGGRYLAPGRHALQVQVVLPPDPVPGVYTGRLPLRAGGREWTIPVRMEVLRPGMVFVPDTLVFDPLAPGATASRMVEVTVQGPPAASLRLSRTGHARDAVSLPDATHTIDAPTRRVTFPVHIRIPPTMPFGRHEASIEAAYGALSATLPIHLKVALPMPEADLSPRHLHATPLQERPPPEMAVPLVAEIPHAPVPALGVDASEVAQVPDPVSGTALVDEPKTEMHADGGGSRQPPPPHDADATVALELAPASGSASVPPAEENALAPREASRMPAQTHRPPAGIAPLPPAGATEPDPGAARRDTTVPWHLLLLLVLASVVLVLLALAVRRLVASRMLRFALLSLAIHVPLLLLIGGYALVSRPSSPSSETSYVVVQLVDEEGRGTGEDADVGGASGVDSAAEPDIARGDDVTEDTANEPPHASALASADGQGMMGRESSLPSSSGDAHEGEMRTAAPLPVIAAPPPVHLPPLQRGDDSAYDAPATPRPSRAVDAPAPDLAAAVPTRPSDPAPLARALRPRDVEHLKRRPTPPPPSRVAVPPSGIDAPPASPLAHSPADPEPQGDPEHAPRLHPTRTGSAPSARSQRTDVPDALLAAPPRLDAPLSETALMMEAQEPSPPRMPAPLRQATARPRPAATHAPVINPVTTLAPPRPGAPSVSEEIPQADSAGQRETGDHAPTLLPDRPATAVRIQMQPDSATPVPASRPPHIPRVPEVPPMPSLVFDVGATASRPPTAPGAIRSRVSPAADNASTASPAVPHPGSTLGAPLAIAEAFTEHAAPVHEAVRADREEFLDENGAFNHPPALTRLDRDAASTQAQDTPRSATPPPLPAGGHDVALPPIMPPLERVPAPHHPHASPIRPQAELPSRGADTPDPVFASASLPAVPPARPGLHLLEPLQAVTHADAEATSATPDPSPRRLPVPSLSPPYQDGSTDLPRRHAQDMDGASSHPLFAADDTATAVTPATAHVVTAPAGPLSTTTRLITTPHAPPQRPSSIPPTPGGAPPVPDASIVARQSDDVPSSAPPPTPASGVGSTAPGGSSTRLLARPTTAAARLDRPHTPGLQALAPSAVPQPHALNRVEVPRADQPTLHRHRNAQPSQGSAATARALQPMLVTGSMTLGAGSGSSGSSPPLLPEEGHGVRIDHRRVTLADPSLRACQLLHIRGEGAFTFFPAEIAVLRHYLASGGRLLVQGETPSFDTAFRREIRRVLPVPLAIVPPDHPLRASSTTEGREASLPEAIEIDGDLRVLYYPTHQLKPIQVSSRNTEAASFLLDVPLSVADIRSEVMAEDAEHVWEDFQGADADLQGWAAEAWGNPVRLTLAPNGLGGEALRVDLMPGDAEKSAIRVILPEGGGLSFKSISRIVLEMYHAGDSPLTASLVLTCLLPTNEWRMYESPSFLIQPGWNRSLDIFLKDALFRSDRTSWRGFDTSFDSTATCGRLSIFFQTQNREPETLLLDKIRFERD